MRTLLRSRRVILAVGVCALALLSVAPPAMAGPNGNTNPGVLPPQSVPFGKTYGEWGAAWQQWAFDATTENSPVTDTTGERALVGQSGHVYFLAGTFGELPGTPWEAINPVTRTITIPTGIALCIPLVNWGLVYPEDIPSTGAPADATWEEAMPYFYDALNGAFDEWGEANMACEVDGVPLTNLMRYRAQSEPFQIDVPVPSVQSDLMNYFVYGIYPGDPGSDVPFYAEGWHWSVSDGYYVLLAPLSAGAHTVHLRAGAADQPFCEVYYNITVSK